MAYYMALVKDDPTVRECVATKVEDVARLRMERGEISRRKLIRKLGKERDRVIMMEVSMGNEKEQDERYKGINTDMR